MTVETGKSVRSGTATSAGARPSTKRQLSEEAVARKMEQLRDRIGVCSATTSYEAVNAAR
jgi:hypothetical protein